MGNVNVKVNLLGRVKVNLLGVKVKVKAGSQVRTLRTR